VKNLGLGVLEEVRDGNGGSGSEDEETDPIVRALRPPGGTRPGIQLVDEEEGELRGTKRAFAEDADSSSSSSSEDDDDDDEEEEEAGKEIRKIVAESTRHGKAPRDVQQPLLDEVVGSKHTPTPTTRGR